MGVADIVLQVVKTMGPLEWILNTPSHHRVHHGRNPYCIDKNYGNHGNDVSLLLTCFIIAGMLIIWDRIFGKHFIEQAIITKLLP